MNIPKQVRIGGTDWSIVEDNDALKDSSHYGETRHTKDEIALDTHGRTGHRIRSCLLHEIVHAIDGRYLTSEHSLSELQVKVVSAALYDTLVSNPAVAEFITGGGHASDKA